jgi:ribokinase
MADGAVGVCGSMNMDLFAYVERFPRPGETMRGSSLAYAAGGKGANQSVAAARLGAEVRFHGARGNDDFGRAVADSMAEAGVDIRGIAVVEEATGLALILVEEGGENQIVVLPGANDRVAAPAPDPAVAVWLAQAEVPVAAVEGMLSAARATGARAMLNPSPSGRLPLELVRAFDVVVVNEGELEALGDALPEAVVLTLGAQGARLLPEGTELPANPAQVVDTTGAGDALAGATAAGLAEGRDPADAVRLGIAAASLCVERRGCQPAMPTRAEVERRLAGG